MKTPLVSPIDYTVSIVEDETVLREELAFQLVHFGFAVETFVDAPAFYRYLATQPRTLVVLDIGLTGEDGLSICEHLRKHNPNMGIVFMSARGLRSDRLAGLEAGGDAYLVKPIDVDELALILQRLGERVFAGDARDAQVKLTAHVRQWGLEERDGILIAPNGLIIRLSLPELQLLRILLLEKPGMICTHAELALALGESLSSSAKHRLEVMFSRLRERTFRLSGCSLPLFSERGVGYRMSLSD